MDQPRKQIASTEIAMANEVFDLFCNATTLKSILGQFRHLCDLLKMRPNAFPQFYPKFKSKLRSWKAQALWKKFDQRANHKCYNRGKACPNTRVLIIGGGPCGLRSAIEAQLLGAKVVVVEKRDRVSRNNVLHLWPFVIQDLRALGAKKFFGKFCAGSIDHISIRQLQCILLKVALILGVEFHENVSFESLVPPPENQEEGKIGWRAKTTPSDHPVSQYEFDVLIGADGKRNTLEGFKRKEFRGKLAIAITANFINKRTEAEARVEEISGVAFIFNQKFFKELYQETGIDLENIVYYKDDTHYFVMTAKKHSLIDKGVILQDHADTAKLLAKENVDRDALMLYAREAAEFSTEYQMVDMEFAVNHYGQPDVAMFDFTSMYAAENASRVLERYGHRLLMTLVGDSLLEPFWPTGSGCARGFLSSMDAGWAIKGWGASALPLEVLAERESIYRLLGQTTPENLNRDYAAYTLDPHTRYPNLNSRSVSAIQVRGLLDTDDPENIKQPSAVPSAIDLPKKRRRRDTQVHPDTLLHWLQRQVTLYDDVHIEDMGASFKDGLAISAIIHRYRPDLIDFTSLKSEDTEKNNQLAFDILEKELGISPVMTGEEMAHCDVPDKLAMFSYLSQIYEAFRGEIPHIKHPKLEPENDERPLYTKQLSQLTHEQKAQLIGRLAKPESATRARHSRSRHNNENVLAPPEKKTDTVSRRSRKRRSTEKMGATVEERQKRLEDIEKNRVDRMRKRQYLRKMATQQFYKSIQMLAANAKREKDEPFEDYSIFLYRQTAPDFKDRVKDLEQKILYPDREPKLHAGHHRGSMDEDISGRIKNFEDRMRGTAPNEKKPRDLLRAIGKIEKTDWNVKEIEKKIEENKMGRGVRQDRVEKVPKWSREQFLARQIKMETKGREPGQMDSKYADIDNTLKDIGKKYKEGNVLGHNKVSAMAEQFANKSQDTEPKVQRSNSKAAITLPTQGGSELCHFCDKRVYLMEKLSAEGKFFHRGCFRCEYCSTSLRIGNHTFDRDKDGGRFYCPQHFGLSGTIKARVEKKKMPLLNKENIPDSSAPKKQATDKAKTPLEGVAGLDLLDRGQTPERIEFENLAGMSDAEEAQSQMDEDEWTDRNFGASAAEMGSSDDISDMSDSDEENEVYEEAMDQPITTEGTIELAKNWTLRYSHPHASTGHSDTGSNEYEDSSDEYTSEDEESGTATEDEEDVRARELRKQEVWLKVPPRSSDTDTGSETEVKHSQESTVDASVAAKPCDASGDVVVVTLDSSVDASVDSRRASVAVATIASETNGLEIENRPLIGNTDEAFDCRNLEEARTASNRSSSSLSHFGVGYGDRDSSALGSNSSGSRKELPDAIPGAFSREISANSSAPDHPPNVSGGVGSNGLQVNGDNLPDLITSSPKLDRHARKTVLIIAGGKNENSVVPAVSVTAATPTVEEKRELRSPSGPREGQDSYEDLKQELKLRRAKKREGLAELRPLSKETARSKVSEYFKAMKQQSAASLEPRLKPELRIDAEASKDEEIPRVPIIPLGAKSQVSDKVESKDLMKYFERRSSHGPEELAEAAKTRRKSSVGIDKLRDINELLRHTEKDVESFRTDVEDKVEEPTPKEECQVDDYVEEMGNHSGNFEAVDEAKTQPKTEEVPELWKNVFHDSSEQIRERKNHRESFEEANETEMESETDKLPEIHENILSSSSEQFRDPENHRESFEKANDTKTRSETEKLPEIHKNVRRGSRELGEPENRRKSFEESKIQPKTKDERKMDKNDDKIDAIHRLPEPPPVEKIKVVVKEIAAPTATIAIPKRPERKRATHESSSPSDFKGTTTPPRNFTPEIPRRRRPDSRVNCKTRESDAEIEPRLSGDDSLPERTSRAISDRVAKDRESSGAELPARKFSDEPRRHASNPLKSLALGKPDVHGSSKSVASSKFDKANKKDKCTIS